MPVHPLQPQASPKRQRSLIAGKVGGLFFSTHRSRKSATLLFNFQTGQVFQRQPRLPLNGNKFILPFPHKKWSPMKLLEFVIQVLKTQGQTLQRLAAFFGEEELLQMLEMAGETM